jgi:hypothetical protein
METWKYIAVGIAVVAVIALAYYLTQGQPPSSEVTTTTLQTVADALASGTEAGSKVIGA